MEELRKENMDLKSHTASVEQLNFALENKLLASDRNLEKLKVSNVAGRM